MLKSIFYRNKAAYIVGRIRSGARVVPLVFALRQPDNGLVIDAVLLDGNDASIVFSYTRWTKMQARHRAGEVIDTFPYRPSQRLRKVKA